MMRTSIGRGLVLAAAAGLALLPAGAAAADTVAPTPSPGAVTVTKAGTSFITAAQISAGQPVAVGASVGDYLYWSFPAQAGQVHDVAVTVTFPADRKRAGDSTWSVDVFDGLRRRQACTAGAQTPAVAATATRVDLGCTLRAVRSWAEPWSGDPLPGTYYVRLSVAELADRDLGMPVEVDLLVSLLGDEGAPADDGTLKTPLVPPVKAGTILDEQALSPTSAQEDSEDGSWFDGVSFTGWIPNLSSRWIWTTAGGILAAVAGVVGFAMTRRPRVR